MKKVENYLKKNKKRKFLKLFVKMEKAFIKFGDLVKFLLKLKNTNSPN